MKQLHLIWVVILWGSMAVVPLRISAQPTGTIPTVQTEDWTTKDIKLPWNQVAVDKSFGQAELVVFTKSFKYKVGWFSNRKERVHARWTNNDVEIFVMRGRDCDLLLGCESGTNYALPKRIKITVGQQDYFLKSIEQNTYALTPEFKQVVSQTNNRLTFKIDERVNFEIQEEALPGLKNLFAIQPTPPTAVAPPVPVPATSPTPVPSPTLSSPLPQPIAPEPVSSPAPANTPLF
jgi:hypothetical protein